MGDEPPPVSEFYRLRAISIVDTTALLGFVVGFVGSSPFAFRYLMSGFDRFGDAATGVLQFIAMILGFGTLGGAAGMLGGVGIAALWQRWHKRRRGMASQ